MRISEYIKINGLWIVSNIAIVIIIHCILFSSTVVHKNLGDILYMDALIITIQTSALLYGFIKQRRKYKDIVNNLGRTEEIQKIAVKEEDFFMQLFWKSLDKQETKFQEREEDYKKRSNELQDYVIQWVHDMKVNLGVCELLLEGIESSQEFSTQIEKMKFGVNQIIHITRANHYDQDISAEEVDICHEIRSAVKENALFFINKNIEINTILTPISVISDKKWIRYIFCQILNNSSKYTSEYGQVDIFTEEDERAYYVHIKDSGMGIFKEDINRVFDKGFTGKNGRTGTKSTGMGLYYVRKMAEALHISIDVKSKEGVFTEFIITFYKLSDYYTMSL